MNVVKSIDKLRSAVGISGRTMGASVGAGTACSASSMGALGGMIRLAVRRRAAVDEGMHRLRLNGCVLWWRCVFGSRAHDDAVEKVSGTFGSSSVRLWLVALHNISIDV